jgi:hypothetical protein
MASWFIRPETVTLPISDGITITVRKRLTAGELRARIVRSSVVDPATGLDRVNWMQINLSKVSAYLLDWTVPDDSGSVVPIRGISVQELETILDLLEPERFAAIHNAIDAHETAMQAQRAEEKKTAGENTLVAT